MKTSEQINELSAALAKAATKFPKIERGCTAKVFPKKEGAQPYSYDYADLDDVLSAVRGPLAENGVTLSHDAKMIREPMCLEVTARLEHSSGQYKESEPLPMPLEGTMSLAQQIGSAYTYGRRYTSQGILGISTEADDDGGAAGGVESENKRKQPKPACPECGKPDHVYEDRQKGGFFCWKKPEQGKHGCGHNWLPADEQPNDTAKPNGKAKEIAKEHGLTTGDKVAKPAKSWVATGEELIGRANSFELLETCDAWLLKNDSKFKQDQFAALAARLCNRAIENVHFVPDVKRCEALIQSVYKSGRITEGDWLELGTKLADAEERIAQPA